MNTKMMMLAGLFACGVLVAGGCNSEASDADAPASGVDQSDTTTDTAADTGAETPAIIMATNENCPKTGRAVSAAVETVSFNDQQIGFCCGGCRASWDNLSDVERTELIEGQG